MHAADSTPYEEVTSLKIQNRKLRMFTARQDVQAVELQTARDALRSRGQEMAAMRTELATMRAEHAQLTALRELSHDAGVQRALQHAQQKQQQPPPKALPPPPPPPPPPKRTAPKPPPPAPTFPPLSHIQLLPFMSDFVYVKTLCAQFLPEVVVPPPVVVKKTSNMAKLQKKRKEAKEAAAALKYGLFAQTAYSAPTGAPLWEESAKMHISVLNATQLYMKRMERSDCGSASVISDSIPTADPSTIVSICDERTSKCVAKMKDYLKVIQTCLHEEHKVIGRSSLPSEEVVTVAGIAANATNNAVAEKLGISKQTHPDANHIMELESIAELCYSQPEKNAGFFGLKYLWGAQRATEKKEMRPASTRLKNGVAGLQTLLDAGSIALKTQYEEYLAKITSGREEENYEPQTTPGWLILAQNGGLKERCQVTICIAGTQNTYDMFRDAQYTPTRLHPPFLNNPIRTTMRCHEGFHNGASVLLKETLPVLERYRTEVGKPLEISLCGHSMGGACAVLLGVFLSYKKDLCGKLSGVYSYGAPKVFHVESDVDKSILQRISVNSYVTTHDIIPRGLGSVTTKRMVSVLCRLGLEKVRFVSAASTPFLEKYHFVGSSLVEFGEKTDDKSEAVVHHTDDSAIARTLQFSLGFLRPRSLEAHRMQCYLQRLQSFAASKQPVPNKAFPLDITNYPFGGKERPLTDDEIMKTELRYLQDGGTLNSTDRHSLERVLSLTSEEAGFAKIILLGKVIAGDEEKYPMMMLCRGAADDVLVAQKRDARLRYELLMRRSTGHATSAEASTQAQEDARLYGVEESVPLAHLNAVMRIAEPDVMAEPPRSRHWRGLRQIYSVAKSECPVSVTASFAAYPTTYLNKLFWLIREEV